MLARMSHPMHTYLLWTKENQSIRSSANTHTNKHRQRQTWSLNANHWAYISIRTNTGRRRVSIATRARERDGLNRNEGERKELVLVVSQTRQDIASRAYVSHLDMRIRVVVVRLNYFCWFVFFKWTMSLRNLPDARPLETYSPVVEGVDVSFRGDNVCLCFRKAQARKEVLYEGTVLP